MSEVKAPEKFTQEIKDKWLEALKSGKYKQGYIRLHTEYDNSFCCLGVLGDVTEGLTNDFYDCNLTPYEFIERTLGEQTKSMLWKENDGIINGRSINFKKMIPIIEALPVQD